MFSTVVAPPFAHGSKWANSRHLVSLQRCPSSPMKAQRPSSRFHTSRRTTAGMLRTQRGGAAVALRARGFSVAAVFLLVNLLEKRVERALDDCSGVAVGDLVAEQVLQLLELVLGALAQRHLKSVATRGKGRGVRRAALSRWRRGLRRR